MKATIIIIFIYLLSCVGAYKFMQAAYSKGGIKYGKTPGKTEIFMTFCPLGNTILTVMGWIVFSPYAQNTDASRFFDIKN